MADAGIKHQTTEDTLASLVAPLQEDPHPVTGPDQTPPDWLAPIPPEVKTRRRRHTDVSQDPRYDIPTPTGDSECIEDPARIPEWILPTETQEVLYRTGHGTAPDLIYARGVPHISSPDPSTFDRTKCNLILIEIGLCQDLGCQKRLQEKTDKYTPLVIAIKTVWGKVELVAVPIDHAGTTL